MGLHDTFITARGQILMMTPLPSVTQAYSLIKQDEKQRQGYNHNNANLVALGVSTQPYKKKFGNNITSHDDGGATVECSYCHGVNHTRETCFKLNGYPKGHPLAKYNKQKNAVGTSSSFKGNFHKNVGLQVQKEQTVSLPDTQNQLEKLEAKFDHLKTMMEKSKGKEVYSPEDHIASIAVSLSTFSIKHSKQWIIDSGATDHMCCNIQLMHSIHIVHPPLHILLPTGINVIVHQLGSVHLTSTLDIHDVLYIPSFHYNCSVVFSTGKCLFLDQSQMKILATGEEKDGLYYLSSTHSSLSVSCSATISN